MKKIATLTLVCLLALASIAAAEHQANLTDDDRTELIGWLEQSRQELEELAALSTGDAWSTKPAEDRWSVGEVVEHLVLAEEGIFGQAMSALASEADPEWEALTAMPAANLVAMMKDRTQKFQAPPQFVPTGESERLELLARFAAARSKTLDFARTTQAPLKQHTAAGPAGKMNAHQWLVLIAAHNLRHNLQIIEAQEQLAGGGMEEMDEAEPSS